MSYTPSTWHWVVALSKYQAHTLHRTRNHARFRYFVVCHIHGIVYYGQAAPPTQRQASHGYEWSAPGPALLPNRNFTVLHQMPQQQLPSAACLLPGPPGSLQSQSSVHDTVRRRARCQSRWFSLPPRRGTFSPAATCRKNTGANGITEPVRLRQTRNWP